MQILHGLPASTGAERSGVRTALTIGNFDGLHLGHQRLIDRVRRFAETSGLRATVLTFDPHPARVLERLPAGRSPPPLLTTRSDKRRLLASLGVETLVELPFDAALAALSPEAFAQNVLADGLRCAQVVVGHDFVFGARRVGNAAVLRSLGLDLGFSVETIEAVVSPNGEAASSSSVRAHVAAGEVETACALLGRPYHVGGTVVRGARRGRALGFPTANLRTQNELIPPSAVYSGWLDWGDGCGPAAISVGDNPTFGDTGLTIEAHVLPEAISPDADLYDREVHLYFSSRLRAQVRFSGPDALGALVSAVHGDIRETRTRTAAEQRPTSLLGQT